MAYWSFESEISQVFICLKMQRQPSFLVYGIGAKEEILCNHNGRSVGKLGKVGGTRASTCAADTLKGIDKAT